MLHQLPGILGRFLRIKDNENRANKIGLALPVLRLLGFDLGEKLSQVLTSVGDGVDLLADKELELVGWSLLWVDKLVDSLSALECLLALFRLDAILIGVARKLDLCGFELESRVVAVLDELLKLLAVRCDPCVLHAGKHVEQLVLSKRLGDAGEEDGLGREATGAPWRAAIGLSEVDRVVEFPGDDDHDQAYSHQHAARERVAQRLPKNTTEIKACA